MVGSWWREASNRRIVVTLIRERAAQKYHLAEKQYGLLWVGGLRSGQIQKHGDHHNSVSRAAQPTSHRQRDLSILRLIGHIVR